MNLSVTVGTPRFLTPPSGFGSGLRYAPITDVLTDDRQHIKIRGRRYTAPPLTSTCSVVCQSYKKSYQKEDRLEKRKLANMFHDALVPFAERRTIKMKVNRNRNVHLFRGMDE